MSVGQIAYKMSFELSPIILTGGVASAIPGGMLPIISITEALNFATGLLSGGNVSLNNFFANFQPLAGATLVDNEIGTYPFANQAVAANAIIARPLAISMKMICTVKTPLGYATKLATMMALQATLSKHNASGGTYIVATPSYFYTDCIMTAMKDVSTGAAGHQAQTEWQFDFAKPLLTLADAEQAQNLLMSKISSGTEIGGQPAWSGLAPTVGAPPSLAAPSLVPAASGPVGAGTAPAIAAPTGS